jgi:hypothetical protein
MDDTLSNAFCEGIVDRHEHRLLRQENLYRFPLRRVAWRLGWEVANLLTQRPLRTAKPPTAPYDFANFDPDYCTTER